MDEVGLLLTKAKSFGSRSETEMPSISPSWCRSPKIQNGSPEKSPSSQPTARVTTDSLEIDKPTVG